MTTIGLAMDLSFWQEERGKHKRVHFLDEPAHVAGPLLMTVPDYTHLTAPVCRGDGELPSFAVPSKGRALFLRKNN